MPSWTLLDPPASTWGPASAWRELWREPSGALAIFSRPDVQSPHFALEFRDLARFEVAFATREIVVTPLSDEVSDDTLNHLLVDQLWPRVIAHEGSLVLHAAGVLTPRGAILIAGPSGRGKSTLAASLHQRNLALLGDDAIIIAHQGEQSMCRAVYPSMRLFPDSIASLFEPQVRNSTVAHYSSKRNLDLARASVSAQHVSPVRAIFFPTEDRGQSSVEATLLSPARACMEMVEHSFWLDPTDVALSATKLAAAAATARSTPAFTLDFPRSFARLDEVHAAMFAALA